MGEKMPGACSACGKSYVGPDHGCGDTPIVAELRTELDNALTRLAADDHIRREHQAEILRLQRERDEAKRQLSLHIASTHSSFESELDDRIAAYTEEHERQCKSSAEQLSAAERLASDYKIAHDVATKQIAQLIAERDSAERERDELREEVIVLRACVSCHLHGSGQDLANAYARLKRFDEARAALSPAPKP